MSEDKKSIVAILNATVTALSDIIIIIKEFSSDDDDAPPLLKKKGYIYSAISAIKTSLLNDFLNLTDNELKILDYVIQYRAIASRNLCNFLHVKRRQIYNYLERLHTLGFITYTNIPMGDGPPTRFYHFANLPPQQLNDIVIAERTNLQAASRAHEFYDDSKHQYAIYKCSQCGVVLRTPKGIAPKKGCGSCGLKKGMVWIPVEQQFQKKGGR